MAKYDYRVDIVPQSYDDDDLENALKQLGRLGWMLQGIYTVGNPAQPTYVAILYKILAQ